VSDADSRPTPRRTWAQRITIAATIAVGLASFLGAGGLLAGQLLIQQRELITIDDPAATAPTTVPPTIDTTDGAPVTVDSVPAGIDTTVPPTFPPADPTAMNFLITGADNNSCISPDSPYYGTFGDRSALGERSDTIMMWRVDPATSQVAVLSFPRDLWVTIGGTRSKQRINSAYRRNEPQTLIDTIYENFGINTDHYIQVDFCAFKTLVDAVGGVTVPFEYPARDQATALNVPTTGCFEFDGEHALAYVRSRKYQYEDPPGSGNWKSDGTSDLGRISRQQDFLRRVVSKVLSKGAYNPSVARGLIDTAIDYIVTDSELTIDKMLEFAGVIKNLDPNAITSYQIEATGATIAGNSVLQPRLNGENMKAILAIFRGEAPLAGAPEQVFDAVPTTVPRTSPTATSIAGSTTTTTTAPDTTVGAAGPEENTKGIVPPRGVVCD
jgi:LCP family protein required for cell wall assembly